MLEGQALVIVRPPARRAEGGAKGTLWGGREDMRRLYQFEGLIRAAIVVAANSRKKAQEEIDALSVDGWKRLADCFDVSDIELTDTRKLPPGPDAEKDLAHISA